MFVQKSIQNYVNVLAAEKPVPGGGSAAALVACIGAALSSMTANFTVGSKNYRAEASRIRGVLRDNERLRKKMLMLVDRDAQAYLRLNSAFKLPRENKQRPRLLRKYLKEAAQAPFDICCLSSQAMEICLAIAQNGNPSLISDAGCAAYFLEAAFYAGMLNVRVNLKYIKDRRYVNDRQNKLKGLAGMLTKQKKMVLEKVKEKI